MLALSGFYETQPWGYDSPHPFLNAAVALETTLEPSALLAVTQQVERMLGRLPAANTAAPYQDRPIDIDILLYDEQTVCLPGLVIPHPLMHRRLFVLQPLAEIVPEALHPTLGQTVATLYGQLSREKGKRSWAE
jgi:2-amino-4-hydroxy-6-hydroxymethyldihydropteridine diphosphokinase